MEGLPWTQDIIEEHLRLLAPEQLNWADTKLKEIALYFQCTMISTDDLGHIVILDKDTKNFKVLETTFRQLAEISSLAIKTDETVIVEAFVLYAKLDDIAGDQSLFATKPNSSEQLLEQRGSCIARLRQLGFKAPKPE